jgi:hypothetical protein
MAKICLRAPVQLPRRLPWSTRHKRSVVTIRALTSTLSRKHSEGAGEPDLERRVDAYLNAVVPGIEGVGSYSAAGHMTVLLGRGC